MILRDADPLEPELALRLAEYQEALRFGQEPRPITDTFTPELDQQLQGAQGVIRALEAARRAGTGSTDMGGPASFFPGQAGVDGTPARFGRFQIVRELGRGGGGVVFLASDPQLNRHVALKVPRPESLFTADLRRRFVREAEAAARLDHLHIVPIHDAGESGGICYLVAAYCPGPNLASWLRQCAGPVPPRQAAQIVAALADGVAHMHSRGIWHRDIKPTNVILETPDQPTDDGGLGFVPRLTDFGLAKIDALRSDLASRDQDELTQTGAILGTPAYMAPEQTGAGPLPVGPWSDIHALGAVLYELLTGRPVFQGNSRWEILRQVRDQEPVAPRRVRHGVPRDLETVCLKCLRKEPARRYGSAQELAQELRRFLSGEPVRARPVGLLPRAWRSTRRHPAVALAILSVLALLAVLPGLAWYDLRLGQAQEVARTHELYRLLFEIKERRQRHPPGWTWDNLRDLEAAARLSPSAQELPLLRSEAAAALAGVDVRPARSVAPGFLAHEAAFSPDGKWLALAQGIGDSTEPMRVLLVDPADGRLVRELPFPSYHDEWQVANRAESSTSLAFSPDGRWLVLGTRSGHVHRWDMSQSEPPLTADRAHECAVDRLAFTAEPQRLYSLDEKGKLLSWAIRPGWERIAPPPLQWLRGMAVLPGTDIQVRQPSGTVAIRYGGFFGILHGWPCADARLLTAAPDGLSLLFDNPKGLDLRKAINGALLAQLPDSGEGGGMPAFNTQGTLLARSSGKTRRLNVWDLASGQLSVSAVVPQALNCVAFHPDARLLAVPAKDQTHLYELRRSAVHEIIGIQPDTVLNLAFGQGGDSVWTVAAINLWSKIGELREWPVGPSRADQPVPSSGCFLVAQHDHSNAARPYPTAIYAQGDLVACATQDKLCFHDRLGKADFTVAGVSCVNDLCFDPGGTLWIADHHAVRKSLARPGSLATVWQNSAADQGAGHTLRSIAAGETAVVVGRRDGLLLHFEQDELKGTQTICASAVASLALSADNRLALAGTELGKVCLVDLPFGEVIQRFPDHADSVTGVAFVGPDLLASGSRDGTIRLWRPDGTPLLTLDLPGRVQRLEASADGTRLAVLLEGERAVRLVHLDRLSDALAGLGLPLDVPSLRHPPSRRAPAPLALAYPIQPPAGPHGLKAEYFATRYFQLKSFESSYQNINIVSGDRWPTQFGSLRCTGWLKAPQPGQYWLWVAHTNWARLWVDDQLLRDTGEDPGGFHGGPVQLGERPVRLRLDIAGSPNLRCRLFWQKQQGGPGEIIPAEALFHDEEVAARAVVRPRAAFAVPAPAERPGGPNGLKAEIYLGDLFQVFWKERYDDQVDFAWGTKSPLPGLPHDFFSIRWSGWLKAPRSGRYTLVLEHDDGARLFLDNRLVLDKWDTGNGTNEIEVDLEADRAYDLRIEYCEIEGRATCKFRWRPPGATDLEVVPKSALFIDRPGP